MKQDGEVQGQRLPRDEAPCVRCGVTESADGDWYRLCGHCRWKEGWDDHDGPKVAQAGSRDPLKHPACPNCGAELSFHAFVNCAWKWRCPKCESKFQDDPPVKTEAGSRDPRWQEQPDRSWIADAGHPTLAEFAALNDRYGHLSIEDIYRKLAEAEAREAAIRALELKMREWSVKARQSGWPTEMSIAVIVREWADQLAALLRRSDVRDDCRTSDLGSGKKE